MNVPRREFLRQASALALSLGCGVRRSAGESPGAELGKLTEAEAKEWMELSWRIDRNRPSRREWLPHDFSARFGAAHVAGKYFLTKKPFLIEGAERLIELGTRLGKFWFDCERPERSYPFHSEWPRCRSLLELAKTDYFEQVFLNPFETIVLEASSPVDHVWDKPDQPAEFYAAIEHEYHEVALHYLRKFRDRSLTIVLQNWEGDWLLRGSDKKWTPPPAGWKRRCEAMQRWLAARQAGVAKARAEAGASKCIVAHAAEVNRVADGFKGIPTMTRNVLPGVEVDLVSYSAYDGMNAGPVEFLEMPRGNPRARAHGKAVRPGRAGHRGVRDSGERFAEGHRRAV